MDERVRNLAIFAVCSVIGLAFLIVLYVNRPAPAAKPATQTGIEETNVPDPYRAFLYDETFFDPDQRTTIRNVSVDGQDARIYLTASSVMRDIRITIQGEDGKPVTGEPFFPITGQPSDQSTGCRWVTRP